MASIDEIKNFQTALGKLKTIITQNATTENNFNETWGWNCPAVTRDDLTELVTSIETLLSKLILEKNEKLEQLPNNLDRKINSLISNTLPNLYNGNAVHSAPAVINTLVIIKDKLQTLYQPETAPRELSEEEIWVKVDESKAIPSLIHRRIKNLNAQLEGYEFNWSEIENQIKLITDGSEAAESLPADLKDLKEAREKIEKTNEAVLLISKKISERDEEASKILEQLRKDRTEAEGLIERCEEAYQITTTQGLAAAFDSRAISLNKSLYYWVVGLIVALIAGCYLGGTSFARLTNVLNSTTQNTPYLIVNILASILSVGAPAWFAWISTKQIGQRFKLSEDYAYKASVAKAYEGYRKQASRIDPEFESRLFSSSLTRLEEAPLRLVEQETHGSPVHEFMKSSNLSVLSDFKNKLMELIDNLNDRIKKKSD